jgi:hypothetical protein
MVDARLPVRRGRAFIKYIFQPTLALLFALVKDAFLAPEFELGLLHVNHIKFGRDGFEHYASRIHLSGDQDPQNRGIDGLCPSIPLFRFDLDQSIKRLCHKILPDTSNTSIPSPLSPV